MESGISSSKASHVFGSISVLTQDGLKDEPATYKNWTLIPLDHVNRSMEPLCKLDKQKPQEASKWTKADVHTQQSFSQSTISLDQRKSSIAPLLHKSAKSETDLQQALTLQPGKKPIAGEVYTITPSAPTALQAQMEVSTEELTRLLDQCDDPLSLNPKPESVSS